MAYVSHMSYCLHGRLTDIHICTTGDSSVNEYLADGTIFTSIYYLNSIGSVNIIEEINSKAGDMSIEAESSPTGFWSLNYAAFVIHRREDWALSVKGFNNYVWDFEASSNQNVFGLYQSHGALLVANSEAALKTHDINNGWDWTRHPGTTTIKMNLDQLVSENRRSVFRVRKRQNIFSCSRVSASVTSVRGALRKCLNIIEIETK